ncbi:MAG: 50S ribosomal protein L24 [SAR202 cluster bacterium]|jgi:ribosomal protein L24, bacterial/organelle|nr:50S ribosomal protein L24 [SAR202 cluster bacterium]MQG53083.1 50S ribosomal protein L24 [SAR202 cluster bacterium]|tara:strand:+ start:895 stop:1215 length:321 start_codon:yes stop_codon:yes gene_type:complete
MSVKTGDMVLVIAGKDKGKTGRVERLVTAKNRVVVSGVNMVTRHIKPRPNVRQAGKIEMENPIHVSNVMLICNKCSKAVRPKSSNLEDGSRVRFCTKCNEVIDDGQ